MIAVADKMDWTRTGTRLLWAALVGGSALVLGAGVSMNHWLPVVGLLALPLVMLWPVQVSLGLFALLIPFDAVSVLGEGRSGMTLTFVVGGAATLVLLFIALAGNRLTVPPNAALWWTLFIAWGLASSFWALDPRLSWDRAPTALALLLMFLVAVSVRITPKEFSWIEFFTILGGFTAAVFCAAQFYSGNFYSGTLMRASMIAGEREEDPNQFALTLLLPLALALGRLFSSRKRSEKILLAVAVALIGLGLLLTMSRGALLAILVLLLVFVYKLRASWRVFLPIGILLLVSVVLPESFFDRLREAVSSRGAGRFDIWIAGLHAAWHHGLWGAGLENFRTAYNDVAGASPVFRGFARAAHNTYLGLLVEFGVAGLLCFALAIRSHLRDAANVARYARSVFLLPYQAAGYSMLTAGMFLDIIWRKSFWFCWMLLAMATALQKRTSVAVSPAPSGPIHL